MAAPTQGWKFSMIGIRVADLERSIAFYRDVFGLEEITRIREDTVTIVFLGYPDGGTTPDKLFRREGVLELLQAHHPHAKPLLTNAGQNAQFGLIKLSITVPNMEAAVTQLKEHKVKIIKGPGEPGIDITARAIGISADTSVNKGVWAAIAPVVFAEDPDGYLVELIQR
ncbi:hypothetical protein H2200_009228 [Cladophialophora chaetospira]|uniref:VOC domain-containing protein n=1 Tax=Cladophialophora chaetospira TaxID=386627 RepID=A0AA38X3R8_9EURO|nr:hypothetical protein H2200_009228 [Cladophialophora chaetospira]